jgi:hypothetical protein
MHKMLKQSMVLFLAAALIIIPFGSASLAQVEFEKEKPSAGAILYDVVAVRPLSFVAVGACAVLYVVAFPFALIGGNTKATTKTLVAEPWKYALKRPVGVF